MFKIIAVPTTPTDLRTLLGIARTHCDNGIALQSPASNAAVVNFGDVSMQPAYVPSGGNSAVLPVNSLDSFYIVGTSGDSIIVMVF